VVANSFTVRFLLPTILLASTIFNVQSSVVRLTFVLLFFALPFIMVMRRATLIVLRQSHWHLFVNSCLWLIMVGVWLVKNSSELSLDLNGPYVEMLTPVLAISLVPSILLIDSLSRSALSVAVNRFLLGLIAVLMIDVIVRYLVEPACFMNYSCRYEAKTVGFFSTTNAIATSITCVLTALLVSQRFTGKMVVLTGLLITTMARAAIISQSFGIAAYYIVDRFRGFARVLLVFSAAVSAGLIIILNPAEIIDDGSLLSKFDFILASYNLLTAASAFDLLFGFGADYEKIVGLVGINDWSPHLPLLKALLYFGVPGVLLYAHSLFGYFKLDRRMKYVLLVVVVTGLAGAPIYLPTLVVAYAIISSSHSNARVIC
jgi:hypothetical protein